MSFDDRQTEGILSRFVEKLARLEQGTIDQFLLDQQIDLVVDRDENMLGHQMRKIVNLMPYASLVSRLANGL